MHPHGHVHYYNYHPVNASVRSPRYHRPRPYAMNNNALLSSAEESNIFGFLDAFDWDLDESVGAGMPAFDSSAIPVNVNVDVAAGPESAMDVDPFYGRQSVHPFQSPPPPPPPMSLRTSPDDGGLLSNAPTPTPRTPKPLLSQPQKRLNHIMSEQKRRNAIKEGYETLAMLLSPGDVSLKLAELASPEKKAQAAAMASEFGYTGRPGRARGSGKNGKAKKMGKGKSGMLFRAVEFCKWLQQDVEALRAEVERLEHRRTPHTYTHTNPSPNPNSDPSANGRPQ
ncbi:unnamed protein product [Rhizoctonia solani]|uniref:BHLH domain-containing protein n=2 Tax=Rhizoctonia solani TaxID=456999 RepID=A0A8H3BII0_9AGAM|nr:unnamed protein product [Rhizoctonia solani]CAE6458590.1 unnamed protein product [Rhizoctonia solani]